MNNNSNSFSDSTTVSNVLTSRPIDYTIGFIPCIDDCFIEDCIIEDLFINNELTNKNRSHILNKYAKTKTTQQSKKIRLIGAIINYLQSNQQFIIRIFVDNYCYCQISHSITDNNQLYIYKNFDEILYIIEQKLNAQLDDHGYVNSANNIAELYKIYRKPYHINDNNHLWRVAKNLYLAQLDINYILNELPNQSFITIGNYGIVDCIFRDFIIHLVNAVDDGKSKKSDESYTKYIEANFHHRFPEQSYKQLTDRLNDQISFFTNFQNQTELVKKEIEELIERKKILSGYTDDNITYLSATSDWILKLRNKYAGHDELEFDYMVTLRQYQHSLSLFVDELQRRYRDILSFCIERYLVPKHYVYDNDYFHPDNKVLNAVDHFDIAMVMELLTQLEFPESVIKVYKYGKSFNARLHYLQINCIEYNIRHNTNYYINKTQLAYLESLTSAQQFNNITWVSMSHKNFKKI